MLLRHRRHRRATGDRPPADARRHHDRPAGRPLPPEATHALRSMR